jgi:hypothetical protein
MTVLIGFHALVQLIAGAEFVAAHRGEERQRYSHQRIKSYVLIHCGISLPRHSILGPETAV